MSSLVQKNKTKQNKKIGGEGWKKKEKKGGVGGGGKYLSCRLLQPKPHEEKGK